jgi:hypothetical protein
MLALVRASGDSEITVPPTIQALLAARLDQLDPAERAVLERGAVEGRVFHHSAVQALTNGELLAPRLVALIRKQLVRPDNPQFEGEEAYRFRHLLIRDAAYDALPKAVRADLHERFADWLKDRASDLVELDEILGHHLEQAARYNAELGHPDSALAERAAERLATAGRRARPRRRARRGIAARAGARAHPSTPARSRRPRAAGTRTHAATRSLCTSDGAGRSTTVSIAAPFHSTTPSSPGEPRKLTSLIGVLEATVRGAGETPAPN